MPVYRILNRGGKIMKVAWYCMVYGVLDLGCKKVIEGPAPLVRRALAC